MNSRSFVAPFVLMLAAGAVASPTYLVLGDSVAFGYENTQSPTVQSNGDRGYVAPVADALGAMSGTRPTVLNLAIPAETSTSFADSSNLASLLNSNYGNPFTRPSQQTLASQKIASLGTQIGTVSFAIGANDYLGLTSDQKNDPAAVAQVLANIQVRYATVLTSVRASLPGATLLLPGYYNPYAPGTTQHDQAAPALQALDTMIQGYAAQYNGRYVDFYDPIEGNQATLIGAGDIHPNDAGYAVLGRVAAIQAVPEPSAMAVLGLGVVAALRRRR